VISVGVYSTFSARLISAVGRPITTLKPLTQSGALCNTLHVVLTRLWLLADV